jgi:hypothetical protein
MKTLTPLTLAALVASTFLASSCEKTSDAVAPLSATSLTKDARPIAFNPNNAHEGTSYIHGAVATGLDGYPLASLELTKIQGTGSGTMYVYKGHLVAGNFPEGGYATPFTSTFPYGGYSYDNVTTLDSNGHMVLKQYISDSQY